MDGSIPTPTIAASASLAQTMIGVGRTLHRFGDIGSVEPVDEECDILLPIFVLFCFILWVDCTLD